MDQFFQPDFRHWSLLVEIGRCCCLDLCITIECSEALRDNPCPKILISTTVLLGLSSAAQQEFQPRSLFCMDLPADKIRFNFQDRAASLDTQASSSGGRVPSPNTCIFWTRIIPWMSVGSAPILEASPI